MPSEKVCAGLKTGYVQAKTGFHCVFRSCRTTFSKLGAETAHSGSWSHMRMVLGKKEYMRELTVD